MLRFLHEKTDYLAAGNTTVRMQFVPFTPMGRAQLPAIFNLQYLRRNQRTAFRGRF